MNNSQIVLIRHGQTEWNKAGRLHGRSDLPLNAAGIEQAHRLAAEMKSDGPWDAVYSSPLFRARQTAQIIADELGLCSVQENPELMEQDFGPSEGLLIASLSAVQRDYLAGQGESAEHLKERAINALFKIAAQHPGQRVAVISHEMLIRAVLGTLTGESHETVDNTEVIELEADLLADFVSREALWH